MKKKTKKALLVLGVVVIGGVACGIVDMALGIDVILKNASVFARIIHSVAYASLGAFTALAIQKK